MNSKVQKTPLEDSKISSGISANLRKALKNEKLVDFLLKEIRNESILAIPFNQSLRKRQIPKIPNNKNKHKN